MDKNRTIKVNDIVWKEVKIAAIQAGMFAQDWVFLAILDKLKDGKNESDNQIEGIPGRQDEPKTHLYLP